MADNTIDIIIRGRDEASAAFREAQGGLDELTRAAGGPSGGSGASAAIGALGGAAGLAATAGLAALAGATATVAAGLFDVSQRAFEARTYLGDIGDAELQGVLSDASLLEARYGADLQSTLGATRTLMEEFGLTADQANSLIVAGFEKGLNTSGDFLDTIGEYSNLFAENGASAEEFLSLLETGLAGGVLGTDKAADAFKEFGIRLRELPDSIFGPDGALLNDLDMSREEVDRLFNGLQDGSVTVQDAFDLLVPKIAAMENPIHQNTVGVKLFGTQWEDLGASAVLGIDMAASSMDDLSATAEQGRNTFASFGEIGPRAWGEFTTALLPASDALLRVANEIAPVLLPMMKGLGEFVSGAATAFADLVDKFSGAGGAGETLAPILQRVGEWGAKVGEWYTTKLAPALSEAGRVFGEVLSPHLSRAGDLIQTYLLPAVEKIANFIGDNLPGAINVVAPIIAGLVDIALTNLLNTFEAIGNVWSNVLSPAFDAMGGLLQRITGGWNNLARGARRAQEILSTIARTIGDLAKGKLPDWLTGGVRLPALPKLPGFAEGVKNFGGGLAIVGERGPELVRLPRGSDVIPAGPTRQLLAAPASGGAGSGGGVALSLTIAPQFVGTVIDNEARMRQAAQEIARMARDMVARELGEAVDALILGGGVR